MVGGMNPIEISPGIRRLVAGVLATVPHLEALLLLRSAGARAWSDSEVAARLYVSTESARRVLQDLCDRGLVAKSGEVYRYEPPDDDSRRHVDELAEIYSRHVVEITSLIHSRTDRAAQQFADAFLLRRGDKS
jgi:predicted ArsR family transcriptional regulator